MPHSIGGHLIGPGAPVFVIAEIGLNHGGSLERALQLVDAAAEAGASAVKLQTLFADRLVAASCPPPAHVRATSLRSFFAQFELTLDAHRIVVARARAHRLAVMTTPFAEDVIPALDAIGFDAYKIASGDITYDGLIAAAARTRQPLVISTGMSTLAEIRRALRTARNAGNREAAIMHCVSAYPAPAESQNLRAIATLREAFGLATGLSDHGSGLVSAVAAVTLGACLYERHLVLEGDNDAIDRPVSSTPAELATIVQGMAHARLALGSGVKACQPAEAVNVTASRRGLYAARALAVGDVLTSDDIVALRPANQLAPAQAAGLVGTVVDRTLAAGDPFLASDLDVRAAFRSIA